MDTFDPQALMERAKELECVYAVEEVLQNKKLTMPQAMEQLAATIPIGFGNPERCRVMIVLDGIAYGKARFADARPVHETALMAGDERVGEIRVGYERALPDGDFVVYGSEVRLMETIARRISLMVLGAKRELSLLLRMLQRFDPDMLRGIGEKLQLHLSNTLGDGAGALTSDLGLTPSQSYGESNTPMKKAAAESSAAMGERLIELASTLLPQGEVYDLISTWVQEQRVFALVKSVDSRDRSVADILDAVRKYIGAVAAGATGGSLTETWLISELCHRFLTGNEQLINLVLPYLSIGDFEPMLERIIALPGSNGNIGGKGAGLFVAKQILDHAAKEDPLLRGIKTPRTWYLATDMIVDFVHYNNLEDLNAYKYNSIFHLRMSFDRLVNKIRSAPLPPHALQMLHVALDDLSGAPLIVRSSSLLEDSASGAFSGKYKSLFLTNQGTKEQRLAALSDAILEVYASMFNPDAIQYRQERGLLNYSEQMGVLIQEVVGTRVGDYFLPAFAGVAFSSNLLRWSPRIGPDDGLVRMVPGLGTRAVDRVSNDYPILFSPAHPELRVNQSPRDIAHYAPRFIDLIDLRDGGFKTMELNAFLREAGARFPSLHKYVSVHEGGLMLTKNAFSLDVNRDEMVVTFDHVISQTDIPSKLKRMLDVLKTRLGCAVDIEFASDGESLYLLQCRPQGHGQVYSPAPIPKHLKPQDTLFTADRFISDGQLSGLTHIVYVDPDGYAQMETREQLLQVGLAVGQLNDRLKRRKYILMGPGRWGSRGDIKLGVRVTYSDISNTAALIEIAKEKRDYVPELSFGTHFFQDLVEAGILYVPLYPDQPGVVFKQGFFSNSDNLLPEILPQYAWLGDVLKVIDVQRASAGKTLSLRMNSELNQAVCFLSADSAQPPAQPVHLTPGSGSWAVETPAEHWQWRHYMAQQLADSLPMEDFGVKGVYLFGSTQAGSVGLGSDIDMLLHVDGDPSQLSRLNSYMDGWSRALARINYLHTGYELDRLLDVHLVTDEDIKNGDSYAIKIGSALDPATRLR